MSDIKKEILEISLQHYLKYGVRKMSNDKLVKLLGISTKTLYKHFKDKEDLISQSLELFYSQQYRLFNDIDKNESAPILLFHIWKEGFEMEYKVNAVFFRDLHHYYPELEKKVEEKSSSLLWLEFIHIINTGKEQGDIRMDIISEAVLEGMSYLFEAVVRKGYLDKLKLSVRQLFASTLIAYIRGICTQKGIATLDAYLESIKPDDLNQS